eukprot:6034762-Amphidinium_carterae.1
MCLHAGSATPQFTLHTPIPRLYTVNQSHAILFLDLKAGFDAVLCHLILPMQLLYSLPTHTYSRHSWIEVEARQTLQHVLDFPHTLANPTNGSRLHASSCSFTIYLHMSLALLVEHMATRVSPTIDFLKSLEPMAAYTSSNISNTSSPLPGPTPIPTMKSYMGPTTHSEPSTTTVHSSHHHLTLQRLHTSITPSTTFLYNIHLLHLPSAQRVHTTRDTSTKPSTL